MRVGILQFYFLDKGYGYLRELNTREEFYFTISELKEPVEAKDRVSFELGENRHGFFAKNIRLIEKAKKLEL